MVRFVFRLDVVENDQGFLGGGRFDHHFLEAAFESTVLFYICAVFVEGCGAYALDLAAGECRFEHVGGVH